MLAEKHFNVGISFLKLNKYQEAIENFDLAIKYKLIIQKLIIIKDFV
ncbi:tetratricopeptide repeat family protein [Orientia tsutsugamushi str. TA763]|nr:tetratricopeptide repeat family protein [Orientia tsutsugamushi str. TA763]